MQQIKLQKIQSKNIKEDTQFKIIINKNVVQDQKNNQQPQIISNPIKIQLGYEKKGKMQKEKMKTCDNLSCSDLLGNEKQNNTIPIRRLQKRLSIEQVFSQVGQKGKFQIRSLFLMCFFTLFYTLFLFIYPYFYTKPIFLCNNEVCDEDEYCNLENIQRKISPDSINSIVRYFELYCENRFLSSVGSSLPYLGGVIGIFLMLRISDNYGRKIAYSISWVIATIGALVIVIFHDYYSGVLVGSFLIGFGCPANNIGQISVTENSVGKFSGISLCIMYCIYGVSMMLIWPITLVTTDWYYITIYFIMIPYILCNIVGILSKESPQYLLTKNLNQGIQLLREIAKINLNKEIEFSEDQFDPVDNIKSSYSFIDLFKFKSLRSQTVVLILTYISISQLYYGMQQGLNYIGDNFVENIFYMGIADFLGSFVSNFACPQARRKRWTMITTFIPALLCICIVFFELPEECQQESQSCYQKNIQIILCVAARFITTFSLGFIGIWCKELYPTPIRSIGGGGVEAIAYGSVTFTPFLVKLVEKFINPVVVIGIISIVLSFFGLFLKETLGEPVQQHIKEIVQKQKQNITDKNIQIDGI